jgi:hypothetical protein
VGRQVDDVIGSRARQRPAEKGQASQTCPLRCAYLDKNGVGFGSEAGVGSTGVKVRSFTRSGRCPGNYPLRRVISPVPRPEYVEIQATAPCTWFDMCLGRAATLFPAGLTLFAPRPNRQHWNRRPTPPHKSRHNNMATSEAKLVSTAGSLVRDRPGEPIFQGVS